MPQELGVVLVETHGVVRACIHRGGTGRQKSVAREVLLKDFKESSALWRAVLRVGVVVVETCAVAKDQIALYLVEAECALGVQSKIVGLIGVLTQRPHRKAPHVSMRVL